MLKFSKLLIVIVFVTVAMAQSPDPPISDTRLTIHTLVREDIFAGFLADDMEKFTRGEKNIQLLLEKRPDAKADLLTWQGGATLYRAVRAYENKQNDEFEQTYRRALDLFAEAHRLDPDGGGVAAVTGGSFAVFADRLPEKYRASAWSQAYDSYLALWKQQSKFLDRLPVHIRGELLGGLAQSAERTGRKEELAMYLDKMIEVLAGTPYEPVAKKWKENPKVAASSGITCLSCHEGGRLSARLSALNK